MREEFEKLCTDLFERVKQPIEQALKNSQLSMDVINQVVISKLLIKNFFYLFFQVYYETF